MAGPFARINAPHYGGRTAYFTFGEHHEANRRFRFFWISPTWEFVPDVHRFIACNLNAAILYRDGENTSYNQKMILLISFLVFINTFTEFKKVQMVTEYT